MTNTSKKKVKSLIEIYEKNIETHISEEGIQFCPAFIEFLLPKPREGKDKGIAIVFLEEIKQEAVRSFTADLLKIKEEYTITEFIFAFDVHIRKTNHPDWLDSSLIILNGRRGKKPRTGILQYSWNKGKPITRKTLWGLENLASFNDSTDIMMKTAKALFETAFS